MYAVVIDQVSGDPGVVARTLAEALGRNAYELRASAQPPGGGPVVVAVHAERAPADIAAGRLCDKGIDAVVRLVQGPLPDRMLVRSFDLTDAGVRLTSRHDTTVLIPFGSIDVLVRSMRHGESTSTTTVRERKFSLGKALLTSGLAMTNVKETTHTATNAEAHEFLLVFAGAHPVAFLGEQELTYPSLGAALRVSRPANFRHLLAELRRLAPRALWDERLVRRPALVQTLGPVLSADDHLDFAAAMVAASLFRRLPLADGLSRVPLFSG